MRIFIIIFFLFSELLYCYDFKNDSIYINHNDKEQKLWSINFTKYLSFNTTPIINSLVGLEMGLSRLFENDYRISLGSAIVGEIPFDSKNFNQDYSGKKDVKSQYFMGVTLNLSIHKYINITNSLNMFFGLGVELLYSNGQSIYYYDIEHTNANGEIDGDLGQNYAFVYIYPQIGINLKKQKIGIYISYNHSINDQKIYFYSDKKYNMQFFTIGLRGMIPF